MVGAMAVVVQRPRNARQHRLAAPAGAAAAVLFLVCWNLLLVDFLFVRDTPVTWLGVSLAANFGLVTWIALSLRTRRP